MTRIGDPHPHASDASVTGPDVDLLDSPHAGGAALRGGALRMGSYVGGVLLSLVSVPLLVRHLGIPAFGGYVAILSLITIVSVLTEAGLIAIAVREYTTTPADKRKELMANLLGARVVFSVVGASAAVVFAEAAGYRGELVAGTALAGVGMIIILCQSLLTVPLLVELRQGWVAALELLRQFISVALIIVLIVLGAGVAPFLAVTIPAGAVTLVMTAIIVRERASLRPALNLAISWPLVRDSIPYALAIALSALYLRLTIVVMSIIATGLELGYFATSFRIVETLIGVPAVVIGAAFPILARTVHTDTSRFAAATARIFELGIIVGSWMVVCVVITAPLAIKLIGGAGDGPAVPVLRIQGFALIATFVIVACGFPLLAERRYREVLLANSVGLAASLALTFALVPRYGAKGGAVATVAAEISLAAASAVLLARSDRGVRLPWGSVPRVVVAAAVALGAGLVLPAPAVVQAVVATAVYALALVLVGRFPPELRSALASAPLTGRSPRP
jgi:O-antigen/teichoic acid export membrane protein